MYPCLKEGSSAQYSWFVPQDLPGPIVHEALTTLYADAPTGMLGNDDLGAMSAWWVLASLGLMLAVPGTDILLLNEPLFNNATVHTARGQLRITRDGQG